MEYKVEVLEKAVDTYGSINQTVKAAEELSELLVALNKWLGTSENENIARFHASYNIREECAACALTGGSCGSLRRTGSWTMAATVYWSRYLYRAAPKKKRTYTN